METTPKLVNPLYFYVFNINILMLSFLFNYQKLQTIGEDFCGLDVNTPLGGGDPVLERPVATMNGVLLTAVAATSTGDFTVVFLGTSKGHVKKVSRAVKQILS